MDALKDIASVLAVLLASYALLSKLRILPLPCSRTVLSGCVCVLLEVWLLGIVLSRTNSGSWLYPLWLRVSAASAAGGLGVLFVRFILRQQHYLSSTVAVPVGPTLAKRNETRGIIDESSRSGEALDGFWQLADFNSLLSKHDRTNRAQTFTLLKLAGGAVLLDVVLTNLSDEPVLLTTLLCRTKSSAFFGYWSAGAGALPISGVYRITCHIDNKSVQEPMEPRLHVPPNDSVRLLIIFEADATGCGSADPSFTFEVSVKSADQVVCRLGPFGVRLSQLHDSLSETVAELTRRVDAQPDDIETLLHFAHARTAASGGGSPYDVFRRVLQLDPQNAEAIEHLLCHLVTKEVETVELFKKLVRLKPEAAARCSSYVRSAFLKQGREKNTGEEAAFIRDALRGAERVAESAGKWSYHKKATLEQMAFSLLIRDPATARSKWRVLITKYGCHRRRLLELIETEIPQDVLECLLEDNGH